jgi:RNA polymerase sigma-70 factor (ECF subfamily)
VRDDDLPISPNVSTFDAGTVLEALRKIEEPFRSALTLFYLEQFSYQEIADVLEVPVGTVMSRLSRGKAQLRERLLSKEEVLGNKVIVIQSDRREEGNG